ncbi:MAG: hypothetical protein NC110_05365 [Ruminococcus sp.]|nr:hypothetical protein [Ruminococcus sp.]
MKEILNDVDATVAVDESTKDKKNKRTKFVVIICIIVAIALIGYGVNLFVQERRSRNELLSAAISITTKYGVDDLTIVSVRNNYPGTIVFQSNMFEILSDEEKVEVFRGFDKITGSYSYFFDCGTEGRVAIMSDGKKYTATINEYGSSYYRYLYADGKMIYKDTYTYTAPSRSYNSSSSHSGGSSGKRTGACSGGSVGCRAGFHPCHEMPNGYCNMCCKG